MKQKWHKCVLTTQNRQLHQEGKGRCQRIKRRKRKLYKQITERKLFERKLALTTFSLIREIQLAKFDILNSEPQNCTVYQRNTCNVIPNTRINTKCNSWATQASETKQKKAGKKEQFMVRSEHCISRGGRMRGRGYKYDSSAWKINHDSSNIKRNIARGTTDPGN